MHFTSIPTEFEISKSINFWASSSIPIFFSFFIIFCTTTGMCSPLHSTVNLAAYWQWEDFCLLGCQFTTEIMSETWLAGECRNRWGPVHSVDGSTESPPCTHLFLSRIDGFKHLCRTWQGFGQKCALVHQSSLDCCHCVTLGALLQMSMNHYAGPAAVGKERKAL